jgi:hypothetical protein
MFILGLKHWMLFLLMLGPPLLASIVADPNPNAGPIIAGNLYLIIMYFLWLGNLGRMLLNWRRPYAWFFWLSFTFSFLFFIMGNLFLLANLDDVDFTSIGVGVMVMLFISLLILARELEHRSPDKQGRQTYLFDAMLLLVFPIGIWWLQPRINELSKSQYSPWHLAETEKNPRAS